MTSAFHELQVTAPGEREIVMTRAFAAPRQLVFDAFTKPELVQRWLLGPDGWSMPVCEIILQPGGVARHRWRNDTDGREFGMHGTFREVNAPARFVRTETFDDPDMDSGEAIVDTTFVEQNGTTIVTMTITYPSRAVRDMALQSGMDRGVAASYDRLEQHVLRDTPASHPKDHLERGPQKASPCAAAALLWRQSPSSSPRW